MKKLLITFLVFCISTVSLFSQNKTIKGRVITEDLQTLPYALIFINETVQVGRTDLNSFFSNRCPYFCEKNIIYGCWI